jgi:glycosyltransferase involved in cell wall biosynthesis
MPRPADAAPGSAGDAPDLAIGVTRGGPPLVYLECTTTYASRYHTGIQRTVRNIVGAAPAVSGPWICVPIIYNGRFFEAIDRFPALSRDRAARGAAPSAVDLLRRAFDRTRTAATKYLPLDAVRSGLHSPRLEFALRRSVYAVRNARRWLRSFRRSRTGRVDFGPGDVLVLLDATWDVDLSRELRRARAGGTRIWAVVQDLIPVNHPDIAPEGLPLVQDAWLQRTIPFADGFLAISRTVADDLRAHLRGRLSSGLALPKIDSFYLGSGFSATVTQAGDLARVRAVFGRCFAGVYLVVGTIEPRKDCARILAAFERLWAEGSSVALLLFGRPGWRSYDLIDRMRTHPEHGRRLFWFEDGSDAELDFAYRHGSALIFASRYEGFGLPLVEAMQHGLPVLASDIPIFREIGGDYPDFFQVGDEHAIYAAIRTFDAAGGAGATADRAQAWLSWSDSARMLLDKVTAP